MLLSNVWVLSHPSILSVGFFLFRYFLFGFGSFFFFLAVRIDPHLHNFICNFSSEAAIKGIQILFIKSSCLMIKLFFDKATQAFL